MNSQAGYVSSSVGDIREVLERAGLDSDYGDDVSVRVRLDGDS